MMVVRLGRVERVGRLEWELQPGLGSIPVDPEDSRPEAGPRTSSLPASAPASKHSRHHTLKKETMSSCSSRINPVDFRVRAQEEKIDFDDRIKSEGMINVGESV